MAEANSVTDVDGKAQAIAGAGAPKGTGKSTRGTGRAVGQREVPAAGLGRKRRRRGPKPYPVMTFENALVIGQGIMEKASGQTVKRMTLLKELNLSDNQNTRNIITNSGRYGVTTGSYRSDSLSLTEKGKLAVDPSVGDAARKKARFELAIQSVPAFARLYETYKGIKLPSFQVMQDQLEDMDSGDRAQCVDIFIQNAKFIGLMKTAEGAEFVRCIDDVVGGTPEPASEGAEQIQVEANKPAAGPEDFDTVCFFIAPIGNEGDDHRKHSDAILSSYVEKALETVEPKLKVVRADKIEQPGMISKQVIEYILKSKLVVADLSYCNPNVFYELALRHTTAKPVVHIQRRGDRIPFDTNNFRTIEIKFDDKFDILAELETVRSTIATYARQALGAGSSTDNPILAYCPDHRFMKLNGASA